MNKVLLAAALALVASVAQAQIKIGWIIGMTGPGASLGVHYKNAIPLLPKTIGGMTVEHIVLDDASDPSAAVKVARKLTSEDHVDVIVGSTGTPPGLAVAEVAANTKTPQLAMSPVEPPADKRAWVFVVPQPVPLMLQAVVDHMKASGVKSVAYIGFNDAWGEVVLKGLTQYTEPAGIKLVANERYARNDTSVNAQVLKMLAANPDAVMIGASGVPGALPQLALAERGFKGKVYHTHGAINRDFIRVGGKAVEGAMAPTGPVIVAEQLSDSNPIKKVATEFNKMYEGQFGADSRSAFAPYSYDAFALIAAAVPTALKKGKPGTVEFRMALRDALEASKDVIGTHAIYNMTPTDHYGSDKRARVMVQVVNGNWKLMQDQ